MNYKDITLSLEGGQEVKLGDVMAESVIEGLKAAGFDFGTDGKVDIKALAGVAPTVVGDMKSRAEKSAKFIKDLIAGKLDEKAISRDPSSFGSAVPTELYEEIIKKRDAYAHVRKYAFVLNQSGTLQLAKDGTMASADWYGDNTNVTESSPTLATSALKDNYLSGHVKIPYGLLNGSPIALTQYVAELIGRSIAQKEESAFVGGDGTNKPTGIRATSGVASVAQAAASLAYDDVIEAYYNLTPQYRESDKLVCMTSTKGAKLLRKLKDAQGHAIFDPRDKTVFNHPLLESVNIPSNLGAGTNETEIWFVDLSQYWIKDGEGLTVKDQDQPKQLQVELTGYLATDGALLFSEAASKLTGVK